MTGFRSDRQIAVQMEVKFAYLKHRVPVIKTNRRTLLSQTWDFKVITQG